MNQGRAEVRLLGALLIASAVSCQLLSSPVGTALSPTAAATQTEPPIPTDAVTATTLAAGPGTIRVDTLEQEAYPFTTNGNCSLGEAIFAADSGKPVDTCPAGGPDESVIELMPGVYHFSLVDETPSEFSSAKGAKNALPTILRPMVIHGNGAVLIRDQSAEPFRFFLESSGPLTLTDMTLKGGDAGDDWGGAIYTDAPLSLDRVHLVGNRAELGGGLYASLVGGEIDLQESELSGNTAAFSGGGAYLESSQIAIAQVDIQSTRFIGNQADGNGMGGGLYAATIRLSISDSYFVSNVAEGVRCGGICAEEADMSVTRGQFYKNEASRYSGAIGVYQADDEEGSLPENPLENPYVQEVMTLVPGLEATVQASADFRQSAQIHDSCFANNVTHHPEFANWSSAINGQAMAEGNYWGDPSGPSGWATGRGDSIAQSIVFEPFLKERPEQCDPALAQQTLRDWNWAR